MRKYICVLLVLLCPTLAPAFDHDDLLHLSAHAGTSYAVQTFCYGLHSQSLSPLQAETLAAIETLTLGLLYKFAEGSDGADSMPRAMAENALGVAGSIATHVTFHF